MWLQDIKGRSDDAEKLAQRLRQKYNNVNELQ